MKDISKIIELAGKKIKVHLVPYKTGYRVYAKFIKDGMMKDVLTHTKITRILNKETKEVYTVLEIIRNKKGTIFGYIKKVNGEVVPGDFDTEYAFNKDKYEELKDDKRK